MIRIQHPKITTDEKNKMHIYGSFQKYVTPKELRQVIDQYVKDDALFLKQKIKEGRDVSPRERKVVCTIHIYKRGMDIYLL